MQTQPHTPPHSKPDCYARWERDTRYYIVHVHYDLWGVLVVTHAWGRIGTAQGQVKHKTFEDRDRAAWFVWNIRRVRRAHGYRRKF